MPGPLVIDAHMHIYGSKAEGRRNKTTYSIWEYGDKPDVQFCVYDGDLEDALKAMDEAGVSRAVIVNLFAVDRARRNALAELPEGTSDAARERAAAEIDATMGERLRQSNLDACRMAKEHSQLIAFVAADPWALPSVEMRAHLQDAVAIHGARGVKLHPVPQRFSPDDPRMRPIYETCIELGIPIVTHTGPAKGPDQYAEPRAFASVLRDFPNLTLVLAHLGGGAWRQTLEIAQAFPNAYFDCCEVMEWTGGTTAATNEQLAGLIREIGPERVLMGSDFPWYDLRRSIEIVMGFPGLSLGEKEAILGANAARVLRL